MVTYSLLITNIFDSFDIRDDYFISVYFYKPLCLHFHQCPGKRRSGDTQIIGQLLSVHLYMDNALTVHFIHEPDGNPLL